MVIMSKVEFIKEVARCVKKYAPAYGILVYSPIIAQACLESGYGTSEKAVLYNNILGLKYRANRVTCNNGYFESGGSEQNSDGSYTLLPTSTAWYRFDSIEKCIEGYFQFINISNYASLKGETDPYQYLVKIKAANYATSINYVTNVYNTLLANNLTQYDPKIIVPFRVAIDAGHGSDTYGKRHPDGYREHYSNVYMSYYLNQILNKNNINTLKVAWDDDNAKDDTDVALSARQSQIKSWGADISISIHANAHGSGGYTSANGIETFYHSADSSAGTGSAKLAQIVHNNLIKGSAQYNRGIKRNSFAMCNCTSMGTKASILVETAFMTNQNESELLKSDLFCRECAKEIAQGIFEYFGINGNINVPLSPVGSSDISSNDNVASTTSTIFKSGDKFDLNNIPFYTNSTNANYNSRKSGTFYVWSNEIINDRVRMTNSSSRVGLAGQITGWIDESVLNELKKAENNSSTNVITVSKNISTGDVFNFINIPFYGSSNIKNIGDRKNGIFYVWSNEVVNGRVRMTNSKNRVGVKGQITGWVDESVLLDLKTPNIINISSITVSNGRYIYEDLDYSPIFNHTFYASKYPDVVKVFGNNPQKLFLHFVQYGMKEGRFGCSTFNVINYKNRYADLRNVFKDDLLKYYKHYIQFGIKEKRNGR